MLCPRQCGADREHGQSGFCGAGAELYVARAELHMWEEPPVSGTRGSGTVFFSNCPLKCVYCQNREISVGGSGLEISEERLVEIFFELRAKGAHNINLVSPTQYALQIAKAIRTARGRGFDLPFVWNTGGYEREETLRMLDGLIDMYLTDFKYMSAELAGRYSDAPDYPAAAERALCEMLRQRPECVYSSDLLQRGVIVRHLVLPGCAEDSKAVLKRVFALCGNRAILSIMRQYTPPSVCAAPELLRRLTDAEYEKVVDFALALGIENAFIQDSECVAESFIPKFDYTGVLPKGEKINDSTVG